MDEKDETPPFPRDPFAAKEIVWERDTIFHLIVNGNNHTLGVKHSAYFVANQVSNGLKIGSGKSRWIKLIARNNFT
jgi:hypothetical protein